MVALPERDVRRFVDFAHETARVARIEPRRFYRWVMHGLGELVDSDTIWQLETSGQGRPGTPPSLRRVRASDPQIEAFRNQPDVIRACNERLAYEHPVTAQRMRNPLDFHALRLSDFTTLTRFQNLESYDILFRPFGLAWSTYAAYRGPRGIHMLVCTRTGTDFDERDMMLLDLAAAAVGVAVRDASPAIRPVLGLTPREAEVLERVARGSSNREIAQALSVAPGTVKKHLDNTFAKLGVRNRLQAARAWLDATRT